MNEYIQATNALVQVFNEGRHLDECLTSDSSPLAQQICYGACRHFYYYDEILDMLLDKPLADKHLDLHLLMVAGLYSIDHLHRPAHASVNAVVESVKKLKKVWAKGMVNAVMRRYGREKDKLQSKLTESAQLNHPLWLIDIIREDWPDHPDIFLCNNEQAPMTLRVNTRKTSREAYLDQISNEGIEAHPGQLSGSAITLTQAVRVTDLPGFSDGLVSIQDEAPQLAPGLMHLFDGAVVLDACAAPGGKTCHILEAGNNIALTAVDRDRKRIGRIQENLDRLSLKAEVIISDLESFQSDHTFDRVLLDVPCSATGIIRRHPDIKLLRNADDIGKLASIQRGLLDKAFDLLGTGGELLYSTCSILRRENDLVISDFLESQPNARLIEFPAPDSPSVIKTPFGLQLLPTENAHDGFYYACISKVAS